MKTRKFSAFRSFLNSDALIKSTKGHINESIPTGTRFCRQFFQVEIFFFFQLFKILTEAQQSMMNNF